MRHATIIFALRRKDGKPMSRQEVRDWVLALQQFLDQNDIEHALQNVVVSDDNGNNL